MELGKSPSRLTGKDLKMSLYFAGCHGNRNWVGKEEQIPSLFLQISRHES